MANKHAFAVTDVQIEKFRAAVVHDKDSKFDDHGDFGILVHKTKLGEVTLKCLYTHGSGTLLVEILKKPLVITAGTIFERIEHMIESAQVTE